MKGEDLLACPAAVNWLHKTQAKVHLRCSFTLSSTFIYDGGALLASWPRKTTFVSIRSAFTLRGCFLLPGLCKASVLQEL